jgi:hypothetical protein
MISTTRGFVKIFSIFLLRCEGKAKEAHAERFSEIFNTKILLIWENRRRKYLLNFLIANDQSFLKFMINRSTQFLSHHPEIK